MKTRTQRGFSLIELIVVISIIALLVGIIGPSISAVRDLSFKAKSTAAIQELASGAMQYKSEYNYYPLQTGWAGNANYDGQASRYFGASMLGYIVSGVTNPPVTPTPATDRKPFIAESNDRFALATDYKIKNNAGGEIAAPQYTPLDQWKKHDEMAVLYYPSNIGNDGTSVPNAFDTVANSAYAPNLPTSGTAFLLMDTKFGPGNNKVFNSDSFLLIAPGIDREYFTKDDVKNF